MSGLTRTVPMADQVRDLLKQHRDRVPHDRSDLSSAASAANSLTGGRCAAATRNPETSNLRPLRFHDLRHTLGSIAIN
jgi:integrase